MSKVIKETHTKLYSVITTYHPNAGEPYYETHVLGNDYLRNWRQFRLSKEAALRAHAKAIQKLREE